MTGKSLGGVIMEKREDRFTIAQFPNKWLWIMIITWPLGHILPGQYGVLAKTVFYVTAVIWSYEEIINGVNWFRNLLGFSVMMLVMVSLAINLGL